MKTSRLQTFFRDAAHALRKSPEVRTALRETRAELERAAVRAIEPRLQRVIDRFEPAKARPALTPQQRASNEDFVRGLYRELLGREPDAGGLEAHLKGLEGGASRPTVRQVFLDSPEYQALQQQPAPAPAPTPQPVPAPPPAPAPRTYPEPGPALSTVPPKPEYLDARIDKTNLDTAARSAAQWVKDRHPEYFDKGDDRDVAFKMMTDVIGVLRAAGYDAHRVVNHPSRHDAYRYGSDALVLGGSIYDVYRGWGDVNASVPQAMNAGPYAPGRLRE